METNKTIIEDQGAVSQTWDYTTKLTLLFVDICDFIGLPVNIPWGLQTKQEEALAYGD